MADKQKILIVEDKKEIARFIQMDLMHSGFDTAIEGNGQRAFERIIQEDYDLVLLDIMLPEMNGLEICKRVRALQSNVPIIMLTAKDSLDDKIDGLNIGADDYITKPFEFKELLARINAALRKVSKRASDENFERRFIVKDLVLYPERYEVQLKGNPVDLTRKEYKLLEYLVENKRSVLTRDQILQHVWGYDYPGDTNVVDVYIRYLRAKIDIPSNERYIQTMRGVGYKIKEQASPLNEDGKDKQ